jgi:hypothetical protein
MSAVYSIGDNVIGLIVRGKQNDKHKPGKMEQHADCILPGGGPIGFFGGNGDASSGSSGSSFVGSSNSWAAGPSQSFNTTGMNMKGMVAHYNQLQKIRPMYVDVSLAKKYNVLSTVLLLEVTQSQASLFSQYWKNLELSPGTFNILGGNCSTHASDAFIAAKVVASGIPGLDTPDNLYHQLKAKHSGRMRMYSGNVGATPNGPKKYDLIIG